MEKLSTSDIFEYARELQDSDAMNLYFWPKLDEKANLLENEVLHSERVTPEEREKKRIRAKEIREIMRTIDDDVRSLEAQFKKRKDQDED